VVEAVIKSFLAWAGGKKAAVRWEKKNEKEKEGWLGAA